METPKLTKAQYKAQWQKLNKEKMATYARNYYHKRCSIDPEYKTKLCEKVKARYVPKSKTFLNDINDNAIIEIVKTMEEPFIFPDPTGIDKDMNTNDQ
jgi:hypothetical protein